MASYASARNRPIPALRPATSTSIARPSYDCPEYCPIKRRFIIPDPENHDGDGTLQWADQSLLDYYISNSLCPTAVATNEVRWIEWKNQEEQALGVYTIGRHQVLVIGCPTAAIVAKIGSPYNVHDDERIRWQDMNDDALARARHAFDDIMDKVEAVWDEAQDRGHFLDMAQVQSVVIGQFNVPEAELGRNEIRNVGRLAVEINRTLRNTLAILGLRPPMEAEYAEHWGDIDENPWIGNILVLAPTLTGAAMPHILIDDDREWSLSPQPRPQEGAAQPLR